MLKELLHPFTIFLLGIILSALLYYLKRKSAAKVIGILSFAWLLLCSLSLITDPLVKNLESRYPVYNPSPQDSSSYYIIILGGGHAEDPKLPANAQLHVTALGRLIEGIRIHKLLPNSKLVLSGYSPNNGTSQAAIQYKTALSLGVDEKDMFIQEKPKNTYEEAEEFAKKFGKDNKIIVVSTATHIPRAVRMFELQGIHAIAAPTNHLIRAGNVEDKPWWPKVKNMDTLHSVIKEYIAMAVINWRYPVSQEK